MPSAKNIEEFETISESKPISSVMVTGSFSLTNPEKYYSVRVLFKEGSYYQDWRDCSVDSPGRLFGIYLWNDTFSYFQKAFPQLVSPTLIDAKLKWDMKCNEERIAAFDAKME